MSRGVSFTATSIWQVGRSSSVGDGMSRNLRVALASLLSTALLYRNIRASAPLMDNRMVFFFTITCQTHPQTLQFRTIKFTKGLQPNISRGELVTRAEFLALFFTRSLILLSQDLGPADPPGEANGRRHGEPSTSKESFHILDSTAAAIRLYGGNVSSVIQPRRV